MRRDSAGANAPASLSSPRRRHQLHLDGEGASSTAGESVIVLCAKRWRRWKVDENACEPPVLSSAGTLRIQGFLRARDGPL